MRYRIEFLRVTTDQDAAHAADIEGDFERAEILALMNASGMRRAHGANGYQVRDLANDGRIVALASFDEPLSRFWPDASDHVVH